MRKYTIYQIQTHKRKKVHLFNSDSTGTRPNRAACGYPINYRSLKPVLEKPLGTRLFLESNDCKRCCQSLENGMLGISVTPFTIGRN